MSAIYYLKNDESNISFKMEVGTTGNVSTIVYTSRSGTGINNQTDSKPTENGNIPTTILGSAGNLIGARLIVSIDIRPGKGKSLDEIYDQLKVKLTLYGGVDGEQSYQRANGLTLKSVSAKRVLFDLSIKFLATI